MATKWRLHAKQTGVGKYSFYTDRVVVIINKAGYLLISPATYKLLGNPERVLLYNDGNGNMGIGGVMKTDPLYGDAFAITFGGSYGQDAESRAFGTVSCKSYTLKHKLKTNAVYADVSVENSILVVNTRDYEPIQFKN